MPEASMENWAEQFFLEYEPGSPEFQQETRLDFYPFRIGGPEPEFPTCDDDPDWRIVSEHLFGTPEGPGHPG